MDKSEWCDCSCFPIGLRRSALSEDKTWNKTSSQILCKENQEYLHDNFCCKNCEAGTHVEKPCTQESEKGTCAPCEPSTYTEHSNGMLRCLPCTSCRNDQQTVASCTRTQDTRCHCRPSTFCVPEQACEVCKKCSRCKPDEEKVQNCTSTSNTVCRKKGVATLPDPTPTPTPSPAPSSGILCLITMTCFFSVKFLDSVTIKCYVLLKSCLLCGIIKIHKCMILEEQQNDQNALREEPQPGIMCTPEEMPLKSTLDEEDKGLGDSLPNTTSSSQTSLPRDSPELCRPLPKEMVRDYPNEKLIPAKNLNGEDALKKSFDIIGECLDAHIYNRFFRNIGLSDNAIKNATSSNPADRVYELLTTWMQREGRKADINYLIQILISLNQRLSAESIITKVIEDGLYKYDDQCS
uniref:Tumor necrosis factor receptor superfamily, member a n=1 Tax=Paramormyrops kingsleyae TaxID=1676925 RepID=A0A3B3RLU2_9TELE